MKPTLLLFSALGTPPFRSIKLRTRKPTCPACGVDSQKVGKIEDIDYVQFCGGTTPDWERQGLAQGNPEFRVGVKVSFFNVDPRLREPEFLYVGRSSRQNFLREDSYT